MKSKQINKFLLMFFLSFTLFFSVSNAIEFTTEGIPRQSVTVVVDIDRTTLPNLVIAGNYTIAQGFELWERVTGNNESLVAYNAFLQACTDKGYTVFGGMTGSSKKLIIIDTNADMGCDPYGVNFAFDEGYNYYYIDRDSYYQEVQVTHHISTSDGYRGSSSVSFYTPVESLSTNKHVKNLTISNGLAFWDGTYKYDQPSIYLPNDSESVEPNVPSMTDTEFSSMLEDITTSELFYQHIPSDYRSNFFVQHDVEGNNYLFYFYPSNYQVNGLLMNENDYHVLCDKDFSWWDNVVDFLKKKFGRETENLDYKMIYVSVAEDGTYSCWYRSKLMLNVDETLFNFGLFPIVYSSVQIPFYGQHGGGGINIDTETITLATEPEQVINNEVYGETNIVYNPNPIETITKEQEFWDKVVNRLSSIVSYVKDIPSKLVETYSSKMGVSTLIKLSIPLITGILTIVNVLISSIALISRAVTFIYTLPTIEASSALFSVDVAETTKGLTFVGYSWGSKFLEGLNMVKSFSWNGLNLWNLFSAFVAAIFAIYVIKYIRKHYHY